MERGARNEKQEIIRCVSKVRPKSLWQEQDETVSFLPGRVSYCALAIQTKPDMLSYNIPTTYCRIPPGRMEYTMSYVRSKLEFMLTLSLSPSQARDIAMDCIQQPSPSRLTMGLLDPRYQ